MKPAPDFVLYGGDIGQAGKDAELKKGKKILDKLKMKYRQRILTGISAWCIHLRIPLQRNDSAEIMHSLTVTSVLRKRKRLTQS